MITLSEIFRKLKRRYGTKIAILLLPILILAELCDTLHDALRWFVITEWKYSMSIRKMLGHEDNPIVLFYIYKKMPYTAKEVQELYKKAV